MLGWCCYPSARLASPAKVGEPTTARRPPPPPALEEVDAAAVVEEVVGAPAVAKAQVAEDSTASGAEDSTASGAEDSTTSGAEEEERSVGSDEAQPRLGDATPDLEAPPPPSRPNFSGHWVLQELEGDFEAFLINMKQPYLNRIAAKALRYGLGKVVVKCTQTGDDFYFAKTLCDPRQLSEVTARFSVGQAVVFKDDIGKVVGTPGWEGEVLVFEAVAQDTRLPLRLRMYLDDRGNFVEEMTSWKNDVIKYTFHARG